LSDFYPVSLIDQALDIAARMAQVMSINRLGRQTPEMKIMYGTFEMTEIKRFNEKFVNCHYSRKFGV
jgi:hypothetical protein